MKKFLITLATVPLAFCTPDDPGRGGPRGGPSPVPRPSGCVTNPDGSLYCFIDDSGMGPPIKKKGA